MPNPDSTLTGLLDDQLANRLLYQRIIVLGPEVDDTVANRVCAQLLLLSAEDPRTRHQPVHQLAGRLGQRRPRDLRHHAADPERRVDPGDGVRREHGAVPADGGYGGQAVQPAARADHDAPAVGRDRWDRGRHRDPGGEPGVLQAAAARADGRAHRAGVETVDGGQRPGPLVHRRAGARVRLDRPGRPNRPRRPTRAGARKVGLSA